MTKKTQQRAPGLFSGRLYGSFAGKPLDTGGGHPVGKLTQQRPPGVFSGRLYSTFTGKGADPGGPHPVTKITQQRVPGVFSGRRYASFAGKPASALSDWDVASPMAVTGIAGTLSIVTSVFQFVGPGALDFSAGTLALTGTMSASGNLGVTTIVALGAPRVSMSGTLTLEASFEFSSAALVLQSSRPRIGPLPQLGHRAPNLSRRRR